jgi:hypothetical protein
MEKKYQDAIRTGLMCGLAIAAIYFIFGLISLWLNSTPAMTTYVNNLIQPYRSLYNNSTNGTPYVFSQNIGQPPMEYYLDFVLSMFLLAVIAIGFIATGAQAIRSCKESKNDLKNTAYIGAVSGIAAYAPVFIVMMFITVLMTVLGSALNVMASIIPGLSAVIPVIAICEALCCCLPVGIIFTAILSVIGALGYAYYTHRIADDKTKVV